MRIDVSSDSRFSRRSRRIQSDTVASRRRRIYAADEDDFGDEDFGYDDSVEDTLDDMADNIEDMQEDIEDIQEDDPDIDVDNNIEGHYIAECDRCHGVFISAMLESDQPVEKITGTCPLCGKESDQLLKWVVQAVN